MERLKPSFPEGLEYIIPFDTTIFVDESIHEVYKTLFEAGVLVLIVILVFLQDWRAVLIPATTVPVTIIGAFAAMAALGFSVNMLTLFGLVLAIGIVVDDAIVIVENAAHHIDRGGLDPKKATIKAMSEVIGPVIGITLVLMAVFLPTAFLGGITGQLYRQFALTIAATALISAINAVTLKPAQCAVYLRPTPARQEPLLPRLQRRLRPVRGGLRRGRPPGRPARRRDDARCSSALVALTGWWFTPAADRLPADRGPGLRDRRHPAPRRGVAGADAGRGREGQRASSRRRPACESWFLIGGQSILDQAGRLERRGHVRHLHALVGADRQAGPEPGGDPRQPAWGSSQQIREASIFAFPPPAIQGLGVAGGFQMQVEDRGGVGLDELQQVRQRDGPRRQRPDRPERACRAPSARACR